MSIEIDIVKKEAKPIYPTVLPNKTVVELVDGRIGMKVGTYVFIFNDLQKSDNFYSSVPAMETPVKRVLGRLVGIKVEEIE